MAEDRSMTINYGSHLDDCSATLVEEIEPLLHRHDLPDTHSLDTHPLDTGPPDTGKKNKTLDIVKKVIAGIGVLVFWIVIIGIGIGFVFGNGYNVYVCLKAFYALAVAEHDRGGQWWAFSHLAILFGIYLAGSALCSLLTLTTILGSVCGCCDEGNDWELSIQFEERKRRSVTDLYCFTLFFHLGWTIYGWYLFCYCDIQTLPVSIDSALKLSIAVQSSAYAIFAVLFFVVIMMMCCPTPKNKDNSRSDTDQAQIPYLVNGRPRPIWV